MGVGSPGLRGGVDLVVVVALSDSLLTLPGDAGVQAIAETVIRTTAASNVMGMGFMMFTFGERTVRYGLVIVLSFRLGLFSDCSQWESELRLGRKKGKTEAGFVN